MGELTLVEAVSGADISAICIVVQNEFQADRTGAAGHDASSLSARERAHHIAYLPQEREIAWPVSVQTLVSFGRAPHLAPGRHPVGRGPSAVVGADAPRTGVEASSDAGRSRP